MNTNLKQRPMWGTVLAGSMLPMILGLFLIVFPTFSLFASCYVVLIYIASWVYYIYFYRQAQYALAQVGMIATSALYTLGLPIRHVPLNLVGFIILGVLSAIYVVVVVLALRAARYPEAHSGKTSTRPSRGTLKAFLVAVSGTIGVVLAQKATSSAFGVSLFLSAAGFLCACGLSWLAIQRWHTTQSTLRDHING